MVNATELKFGDPGTRLAQTDCWTLLLRPRQPTLGSMVLVCREPVQALGELSERAFVELRGLTRAIEAVLREFVGYQRINYLMLMMVDRDVHFHVVPRYEGSRSWAGVEFPDVGWPGPPALDSVVALDSKASGEICSRLRDALSRFAG